MDASVPFEECDATPVAFLGCKDVVRSRVLLGWICVGEARAQVARKDLIVAINHGPFTFP